MSPKFSPDQSVISIAYRVGDRKYPERHNLRVSEVRLIEHPHSGVPYFRVKAIAPDASGIDAPEEYFRAE